MRPWNPDRDLQVVASSASTVPLEASGERPDALAEATTYGLDWPGGYAHVRAVVQPGDVVTRQLAVLSGELPRPGQPADLRRDAFPGPAVALGQMRTMVRLGLPSLAITYRRDAENGGGLAQFGQDESADVDGAVQYALDHGARRVVLVDASMGGSVCTAFLERSVLAPQVAALVLDAPMLDLDATIEHGAAQRRLPVLGLPLPGVLTWTAQRVAAQRFGLDSDDVDRLDDTAWLTVPALVFHGTSDDTFPVSVTRRLAAANPELTEHVLVEGAEHVESWNVEPRSYDEAVRRFLAPLVG